VLHDIFLNYIQTFHKIPSKEKLFLNIVFPCCFFSFFFEGKLSHILEDELFQENKRKAQLEAYKIGFKLLFVVIWLMAIGMFSRNVEWCAMFMLISVSLIYALVLFLSNYLLYRYEKRE
jgi:hypothetical protein